MSIFLVAVKIMLDIYICEDDMKQLVKFKNTIANAVMMEPYDMELSVTTANPHEVIEVMKQSNNTGIYFLDIDLKSDIDGFDLSEAIRRYDPRGFIIFITANADMFQLTFKYKCEAMDFIVKGSETNIDDRIRECLKEANIRFLGRDNKHKEVFIFKFGDTFSHEEFGNIVFFEINADNTHKVSMYSMQRAVDFRSSLKEVETGLDNRFIRCNNSCIINIDMIENINKRERLVTMKTGQKIDISIRSVRPIIMKAGKNKVLV